MNYDYQAMPEEPMTPPEQVIPSVFFSASDARQIARSRLEGQWRRGAVPALIFLLINTVPGYLETVTASLGLDVPFFNSATFSLVTFFIAFFVTGAMEMGMASISLSVLRQEPYSTGTVFFGFSRYGMSFFTYLLIFLFSLGWGILFLLPGIILSGVGITFSGMTLLGETNFGSLGSILLFIGIVLILIACILLVWFLMRYEMAYFLAVDHPELRANEAIRKSVQLMAGSAKIRLFFLSLSFIGWIILASIPAGIAGSLLITSMTAPVIFISLLLGIVSLIAYSYVTLYSHVSFAVFYSGLTGNYQPASFDNEGNSASSDTEAPVKADEEFKWNIEE